MKSSVRFFTNKVEDFILNQKYLKSEGFVFNKPYNRWDNEDKRVQIADELVCQLPFDEFFLKIDHIIRGNSNQN
jgi:hypothetical protein